MLRYDPTSKAAQVSRLGTGVRGVVQFVRDPDAAVSVLVTVTNGIGIVAERAMWWPGRADTWAEAHSSQGTTTTSPRWTVADGEEGGPQAAETYLLVANTADAAGQATVTLLLDDGTTRRKAFALAPRSRTNVAVGREFPDANGHRFGAVVESTGAIRLDLVVERASYWDGGGERWGAGTNTLATPDTVADVTVDLLPEGIDPEAVEINVGDRIRFVNRDRPGHVHRHGPAPGTLLLPCDGSCRPLGPGESAVSGPFLLEQTCTLHEHLRYDPRHHATVVLGR